LLAAAFADLGVILQLPNPIEASQVNSLPAVGCKIAYVINITAQMQSKLGLDQILNLFLQELNGRPLLILL
jgi:hypothetical protein